MRMRFLGSSNCFYIYRLLIDWYNYEKFCNIFILMYFIMVFFLSKGRIIYI